MVDILGFSTPAWVLSTVAAFLLLVAITLIAYQRSRHPVAEEADSDEPLVETLEDNPNQAVTLEEPDLRTARLGIIGQFFKYVRYRRKQRKLAAKGYVKWFMIDGVFRRPKYVRPKSGEKFPEYEYKGETYFFPRNAAVPDGRSGMWTMVHKKGEADPVNLRDPSEHAISAKAATEQLGMRVSSSPPSLLERFNIDSEDAIYYAIAVVIVLSVVSQFL